MDYEESFPRVNIFQLPSEITIILILTVFISIGGILVLSGSGTWIIEDLSRVLFGQYIFIPPGKFQYLTIIFIFLGILIYLIKPLIFRKREGLILLSEKYPEIDGEIHDIMSEAAVSKDYTLLYSPSPDIDIYAFGDVRRYYIALTDGFLKKFRGKEGYYAILYHEMAHIVNGDIFAKDLASSFILSYLLFLAIYFIAGLSNIVLRFIRFGPALEPQDYFIYPAMGIDALGFIDNFGINIIVVFIIALVLKYNVNLMLQYRELYADARAIQWLGSPKPLLRALVRIRAIRQYQNEPLKYLNNSLNFISKRTSLFFLNYHPPITKREAYIHDQSSFSRGSGTAILIGFFAFIFSYLLGQIEMWFSLSLNLPGLTIPLYWPTFAIVTMLILPKYFWYLVFTQSKNMRILLPIIISQFFAIGFVASSFIIVNTGLIISLITKNILFYGGTVQYNYSFDFIGISWPIYFPAIGIIIGELHAVVIFIFLFILGNFVMLSFNFLIKPVLERNPMVFHAILPYLLSLIIITLLVTSYTVIGLVLLAISIFSFQRISIKMKKCPNCQAKIIKSFAIGLKCQNCGNPLDGWLKNAL